MLKNELVYIRAIEPEDLEFLYKWENDTDFWEVSNNITPYSKFILKNYIETSHQDIYTNKQLRFIICSHDQLPIGTIDLFEFDPYNNRAGVGILIAEKDFRNKGMADAALKLLLDYVRNILKLRLLFCNITANNHPSINLFERNGFEKNGAKKQWNRSGDTYEDELYYQIIL